MNILLITLVLLKESIILEIMLQESSSSLYSFPWVAGAWEDQGYSIPSALLGF